MSHASENRYFRSSNSNAIRLYSILTPLLFSRGDVDVRGSSPFTTTLIVKNQINMALMKTMCALIKA